MDISKVKLRVKKPDGAEENSRASKFDNSSNAQEDFDMDEDNGDEGVESSPINLSIRKSSRPSISQPVQTEVPDKVQKKAITSEKEPPKVKQSEKKVTMRQKRIEKVNENLVEKEIQTETLKAAENTEIKAKRRVKRLLAEKTTVHYSAGEAKSEKDQKLKPDQQRSENKREARPEKEKEQKKKNDNGRKDNKRIDKFRKSGSKKSMKIPGPLEDIQQQTESPEKIQKVEVVKGKAAKRKAAVALDLSQKSSSEILSKARRLKATATKELQVNSASEDSEKIEDTSPTSHRSKGTTPGKQKKTRNTSKRATGLQQAVDSVQDKVPLDNSLSIDTPGQSTQPHLNKNSVAQKKAFTDPSIQTVPMETVDTPSKPSRQTVPKEIVDTAPKPTIHAVPEETLKKPEETLDRPPEKMEGSSSGEKTSPPAEDCPAAMFLKPTCPPSLVLPGQRSKPADLEEDEGIHSSHEGGSDISDSASEGSDDSGLHSHSNGLVKMANDPETPTEEIPTPTELKSHLCIFCDRTFPLEVEYRRHLNRHLVNVYYMNNAGQK